MRTHDGNLVLFINGTEVGVAVSDIPKVVYGAVDIYGQCAEVEIVSEGEGGGGRGGRGQAVQGGTQGGQGPNEALSHDDQGSSDQQQQQQQQRNMASGSREEGGAAGPAQSAPPGPASNLGELRFDLMCGENVEISTDGRSASRIQPYEEFTRATVFTSRALKPGEWFEVKIDNTVICWNGSLQLGNVYLYVHVCG